MSTGRLGRWWQAAFSQWLNRRVPAQSEVLLSQRNIFIFPSRFGGAYLVMVSTLFLLGSNYQNNLILALAYLLSSLFVTSIFHSFFNLSGLVIQGRAPRNIFLGESVRFELRLKANARAKVNARFFFVEGAEKERYDFSLGAKGGLAQCLNDFTRDARLGVTFTPKARGWFQVERLRLSSHYPLGILTCWTLLAMKQKALVYPAPVICPVNLGFGGCAQEGDNEALRGRGEQEFIGIRPYRVGETMNQIAWKQVAQGRGWVSKEFSQPEMSRSWLSLSATHGETLELRLGKLCYQVVELSRSGLPFGLDLGAVQFPPAIGREHKLQCLEALALYE